MVTVFKYPIAIQDDMTITLPHGAKILCFAMQWGTPCLWAKVDTEQPLVTRHFRLARTGHPLRKDNLSYIGTVFLEGGELVFHLFEEE